MLHHPTCEWNVSGHHKNVEQGLNETYLSEYSRRMCSHPALFILGVVDYEGHDAKTKACKSLEDYCKDVKAVIFPVEVKILLAV